MKESLKEQEISLLDREEKQRVPGDSWDGMGDAKKPGSGESNPKFDRARMLRHTSEKERPFPTSPSQ